MSNLKLTDYETAGNTYTFPYNPNDVTVLTSKYIDQKKLPYSFTFLGFTSPIKSPIDITLSGHFNGTNKDSYYRSVAKLINSPTMLKVYFKDDYTKYYLCTGITIKKVNSNMKPNHVNYVANFFSPFGILFDNTLKSGLASTSNEENEGNIETPIELFQAGVSEDDVIVVKDGKGNGWTLKATMDGVLSVRFIKIVTNDNFSYVVEYMHAEIDNFLTKEKQIVSNADPTKDILIKLSPGESLDTLFTGGTVTSPTSSLTMNFRDGWSSD